MKAKGFTILELLLALALASAVMIVCFTMLSSTIDARNHASETVNWARISTAVFDVISEDLLQATKPKLIENLESDEEDVSEEGEDETLVEDENTEEDSNTVDTEEEDIMNLVYFLAEDSPGFSDKDGITFVVAQPGYDSDSGEYHLYREISYFVRRDTRTNAYLLYRREQNGWDGDLEEGGSAELLCDIIGDFVVKYYDGIEWLDEWDVTERGQLPIAVRLQLSFYFEKDEDGLPDTTKEPTEFYTIVRLRASRYIHPDDSDRMEREGIIESHDYDDAEEK